MTASPFSHPWLSGLFGDPDLSKVLGPDAQLDAMRQVIAAYSHALGYVGVVSADKAETSAEHVETVDISVSELQAGTATDGVVVANLVRQIKAAAPDDLDDAIYVGMTSQDVIDTAWILQLRSGLTILRTRLSTVVDGLNNLDQKFGQNVMSGRTRMQLARPIKVSERIRAWRQPLEGHIRRLDQVQEDLLRLQLGGPAGDRSTFFGQADAISNAMAQRLGLSNPLTCWHSERDSLVAFSGWLAMVSGTLGKMGTDLALMAQQGVGELTLSGGGASSSMPHKQNPVLAELLVTLAHFNATQSAGMQHAMVHEQERSGATWALEWMLLPQMVLATGRGLVAADQVINAITKMSDTPT